MYKCRVKEFTENNFINIYKNLIVKLPQKVCIHSETKPEYSAALFPCGSSLDYSKRIYNRIGLDLIYFIYRDGNQYRSKMLKMYTRNGFQNQ